MEPLSPPLQQQNEPIPPLVPKLELPADPPPPPPVRVSPRDQVLSVMAEKKRQKWNREKGAPFGIIFLLNETCQL